MCWAMLGCLPLPAPTLFTAQRYQNPMDMIQGNAVTLGWGKDLLRTYGFQTRIFFAIVHGAMTNRLIFLLAAKIAGHAVQLAKHEEKPCVVCIESQSRHPYGPKSSPSSCHVHVQIFFTRELILSLAAAYIGYNPTKHASSTISR
ncbi:hypothetical protein K440DRAFT_420511 [Wilcoxina mikolae CBS 423.85]|nr:hypothetical protein K440DRAFT_420511 [Wilcoxina mikolae CBS 423.85]